MRLSLNSPCLASDSCMGGSPFWPCPLWQGFWKPRASVFCLLAPKGKNQLPSHHEQAGEISTMWFELGDLNLAHRTSDPPRPLSCKLCLFKEKKIYEKML